MFRFVFVSFVLILNAPEIAVYFLRAALFALNDGLNINRNMPGIMPILKYIQRTFVKLYIIVVTDMVTVVNFG